MLTTDTMFDTACAHRPTILKSTMRNKDLSDAAREGNLDFAAVAPWRASRAQHLSKITSPHHCGPEELGKTRLHVVMPCILAEWAANLRIACECYDIPTL